MSQDVPNMRTERYETIIIGGGQAGLAAANELQGRDLDYLVLDPGIVVPAAFEDLANKTELAVSLAAYGAHFDLALRLGVSVHSVRRAGGHFEILACDLRYEATSVIVAMGSSLMPLDLRWVQGQPGLYLLDGVGRNASLIAEQIATSGL